MSRSTLWRERNLPRYMIVSGDADLRRPILELFLPGGNPRRVVFGRCFHAGMPQEHRNMLDR
jgi:hypothetical protein